MVALKAIDPEDIILRNMTMEDIPDIMLIEHEAFSLPWSEDAFRNELTHNHFARYLVMEHEGSLIGYAGMWNIVDESHVTNIAIRTVYRGLGLGKRLLRAMMDWAIELGMLRMTLEVRVSNLAAQSLYSKFGFYPVGTRKGYYSDNHEDAVIMWCELPQREYGEEEEGSEWD